MSSKTKIILWVSTLIVTVGLIASWFYWFQWRETKAIKNCTKDWNSDKKLEMLEKYTKIRSIDPDNLGKLSDGFDEWYDHAKTNSYDECMSSWGFK